MPLPSLLPKNEIVIVVFFLLVVAVIQIIATVASPSRQHTAVRIALDYFANPLHHPFLGAALRVSKAGSVLSFSLC